CARASRGFDVW
nr:immunoglobulin heavy chain junction region [Macaca mulatta]